ncbi:unnamed protein product [Durusdinium trenchii]|uniref:Uncharacterized protein n=2 Tax=Durusdinium trenchii TaxID=1381693 RepID=A0ABP0PJH8_9DINO
MDVVLLLEASLPLQRSGEAILRTLPKSWLDITGNNTALGTRCLFASRRHENSVLAPVLVVGQIPAAAKEWQMEMVPSESFISKVDQQEQQIWAVNIHPEKELLRVMVRPGALLLRMLRRGALLPAARFVWRLQDSHAEEEAKAPSASVGEFSILSNLEDPATTQPPHFVEHPLRREQLRSLGWMLNQERPEKEAFATELRDTELCPDAAHWRLEGSLRCEYLGVRGGVLADAIGYGKTACTIGLIDKTKDVQPDLVSDLAVWKPEQPKTGLTDDLPMPRVPMPYRGFVPSRATLVLAPSNLQRQFTGPAFNVLSVPTCTQLKRLSMSLGSAYLQHRQHLRKDLAEADVVVATYRLFYSAAYLERLEELARESLLGFTFPKKGDAGSFAGALPSCQAYRQAFEALPTWSARRLGLEADEAVMRRDLQELQESSFTLHHDLQEPMTLDQQHFVPLEAFWWRRVVCDEFHELLTPRYAPAQVAVELFHGDFKWLTADGRREGWRREHPNALSVKEIGRYDMT